MTMKSIVLAAALVAAAASPAFAKSGYAVHHARAANTELDAHAAVTSRDPLGVYVQGQEIGRDPDANIRNTLKDEYYELQGN